MDYDVAVAGLGGMGSAILAHCARRGARAVGFDQFARGHELGSSSGRSRMIRRAYFEDPAYVPLVTRAFELWRDLERETGAELLKQTGVLAVGGEGSEIIRGIERAALQHTLPIEKLSRAEVATRYPMLQLRRDEAAILEPEAGVLRPEEANAAHLALAEQAGAATRFECALQSWQAGGDRFELLLGDGSTVTARRLVLSLGPWFGGTLNALGATIRVQRNVQAWFAPARPGYAAPGFPPFLLDRAGLPAPLYGFPDFGEGVKVAFHGGGELTTPAELDRTVDHARDIEPLVRAMEDWMPGAADELRSAKPCMYSLTADEHFVIDRHPEHPRLILCGGFSGHGFKFAPVIGEIAADLALSGGTKHEIDFLSLRRFRPTEDIAS